jgi:flavin reductase (DIM6/NTAB) family NADH-FMN oxidoreductase RutF
MKMNDFIEMPKDRLTDPKPPGPTILVSTINKNGLRNLAPMGMFMSVSIDPPMLAVGLQPTIDTYKNISETKEFVIGIPGRDIASKVWKCKDKIEDEFTHSGLTAIPSLKVKPPSIKECQVNFECKLVWEKESGDHTGDHIVVVGEVIATRIKENLSSDSRLELRKKIDYIFYPAENIFFTKDGKIITV